MSRPLARSFLLMALALAMGAARAAMWPAWTLVDLGTLGGPGSYGAAVSDNGIVVGCSDLASSGVHAFVWRAGVMRDLGAATADGAGDSCALAVNDAGVVAGRSGSKELVIWDGSTVTHLGVRGDVGGMNGAGSVVGSFLADGARTRAFLYRRGVLQDLGTLGDAGSSSAANAVNAKDQVVGTSNGRAFLFEDGAMRDLGTLGGVSAAARGINDRGEAVGMAANAYGEPTAFLYDGTLRALPGDTYTMAIAINNRGAIVASGEGTYGSVVVGGEAIRLDTLPVVRARGWRHLEPTGINGQGWIVGTGVNPDGALRAFLLVPK